MRAPPANVLVLGASYGLLPGVKLSLAGHAVTFVGRSEEIADMARGPLEVRMPLRRTDSDVTLQVSPASRAGPGRVSLRTPEEVDPLEHDFVILAMQEPQYKAPGVKHLMERIGASRRPCLSIMNLPPRSYLERFPSIAPATFEGVYASGEVWQCLDPAKITMASPDAQAVRLDPNAPGKLTVTLASNFKVAPFEDRRDQVLLERLARDGSQVKVASEHKATFAPVMLVAKRSLFTPLAKWPMLIAGNCRCLGPNSICSIGEAVLTDRDASRTIYDQVNRLLLEMGAERHDLVAFDSYCKAASDLRLPSSLARALSAGAREVERIDLLVFNLMRHHGIASSEVEDIVATIEGKLAANRVV